MTPGRTSNSSSSATLPDLMDGLRLRLLLALWAGVLVLVLSALYDLPTNSTSSTLVASGEPSTTWTSLHRGNLRGTAPSTILSRSAQSSNIIASETATRISLVSWRPFLEEEARTIDMLSQPFHYLFWSFNAAKES